MTSALTVRDVSKSYGKIPVLHSVAFECPRGQIVAFVGPNGAGKSTTMRIVCRLSTPDSGEVIFRANNEMTPRPVASLVGAVLDPAAHHPGRTVWTTVRLPALMMGVPDSRVKALIEYLGLGSVRRRRFGQLSLGMKQRVSLAIALLADPEILVLDEPMNGLDVDGIDWTRTFLQNFAANGGTVLVSSHLLNELQTFADRMVIISRGRIVADQLVRGADPECELEAADPEALQSLLVSEELVFRRTDAVFRVASDRDRVARLAFEKGVLLLRLQDSAASSSIERTYRELADGEFKMNGVG